jgi:hypothetical protein
VRKLGTAELAKLRSLGQPLRPGNMGNEACPDEARGTLTGETPTSKKPNKKIELKQ